MSFQTRLPVSYYSVYPYSLTFEKLAKNDPRGYSKNCVSRKTKQRSKLHRNFWKSLFSWTFACIGLIWQLNQVNSIYFGFTVRVEMTIEAPYWIAMPGLTICLKFSELNHDDPLISQYLKPFNLSKGDNVLDYYAYIPDYVLEKIPTMKMKIICRSPWPELTKLNKSGGEECENYAVPLSTIQYDYEYNRVYKCVTYFHRKITQPEIKVINKFTKDFYRIKFRSTEPHSVALFVHDPAEVLHINEANTFRFRTDETFEIISQTTKMQINLLPWPYVSDCVNFTKLHFGRTSCIAKCKIKYIAEKCNLWPQDVPIRRIVNTTFKKFNVTCTFPDRHRCTGSQFCKYSCNSNWYTTTLISSKKKYDNSTPTSFYVRRPSGAEIIYNFVPRMELIEFMCYIASSLGIWFGFSFADIVKRSVRMTM